MDTRRIVGASWTVGLALMIAACGSVGPSSSGGTDAGPGSSPLPAETSAVEPFPTPDATAVAATPLPDPWAEGVPAEAETERDDMTVSLTLIRDRIVAGEPLGLIIRVRNGGTGIASWLGDECQLTSSVQLEGPRLVPRPPGQSWSGDAGILKETTLSHDGGPIGTVLTPDQWDAGYLEGGCDSIGVVSEIAPGRTIELLGIWPTETPFGEPIQGGQYRATLAFPHLGRENDVEPEDWPPAIQTIQVSAALVIEPADAPPSLSPGQVVDAVLGDPQFATWLSGLPLERWDGSDLRFGDGIWQFTLRFDMGEGEARVSVDAISGLVIERHLP